MAVKTNVKKRKPEKTITIKNAFGRVVEVTESKFNQMKRRGDTCDVVKKK
jgi:hypothetical protein